MDQGYEDSRFQNVVNKNFHCPICMNVLKQPTQCRNNEHYFCSPCIRRHLEQNSQSCPLCIEELTIETLRRPSRIMTDYLSSLMISCDHADRGCREIVELEVLESHVADCDFSPVICSNDGCLEVINKKDVEHHEIKACGFKGVRCDDCDELFPGSKIYNAHVCVLRREMAEMKRLQEDMMKGVNGIFTEIKSMREEMKRMQTPEVNNVKQNVYDLSGSNSHATSRKDIIAVGGFNNKKSVASAERFSWREEKWKPLPELNGSRFSASAVVFENQLLVCGGKNNVAGTDSIEKLNLNQKPEQWLDFPAKLPFKCRGHKCVVYGNRLFVIGGYTNEDQASDCIYEVLLVPPYSSKLLCRMKQKRCYHGVELFDDKIFIVGGKTSLAFQESVSDVEMYDITKNECKKMPPLPSPVCRMATVGWDDNIILIGGSDKNNHDVNAVIAYDIKTGVSKVLPSMKNERSACAAVVPGDRIVVMGGVGPRSLDSVECFDFLSHSWIELTSMIEPRQHVAAILSPL